MANLVVLTGRFVADPEVKNVGDKAVCNFSLAVDRDRKAKDQPSTDFFRCTAWGGTATAVGNCLHKGSLVNVTGKLQNREYTGKDGQKRTQTEVIADRVEFLEPKAKNPSTYQQASAPQNQYQQTQPAYQASAPQYAQQPAYQQPAYQQAPQSGYMDFSGGYSNYQ